MVFLKYFSMQKSEYLFDYWEIDPHGITCRMLCEYFVKNGRQYQTVNTEILPDCLPVISVNDIGPDETYPDGKSYKQHTGVVAVEVRDIEKIERPLVHVFELYSHEQAARLLCSDNLYVPVGGWNRDKFARWVLDSRETDEDRGCYVFYGNNANVLVNRDGEEL